jgi:hypothetical protein
MVNKGHFLSWGTCANPQSFEGLVRGLDSGREFFREIVP